MSRVYLAGGPRAGETILTTSALEALLLVPAVPISEAIAADLGAVFEVARYRRTDESHQPVAFGAVPVPVFAFDGMEVSAPSGPGDSGGRDQ